MHQRCGFFRHLTSFSLAVAALSEPAGATELHCVDYDAYCRISSRRDLPMPIAALALGERYGCVVSGSMGLSTLGVLDLDLPGTPVFLGSFSVGASPWPPWDVAVRGDAAYVPNGSRLDIVDLSNPSDPTLSGSLELGSDLQRLETGGHRLYVTLESAELRVLDVSNPLEPVIASPGVPLAEYALALAASAQLVCVSGASGVTLVDAAGPGGPAVVATIDMPVVHSMALAGDRLYTLTQKSLQSATVWDVSDASAPVLLGALNVFTTPGCAVAGERLYATAGGEGIAVIDVADPANPVLRGHVDLAENGPGVSAARGDIVYATRYDGDLFAFEMEALVEPAPLGRLSDPPGAPAWGAVVRAGPMAVATAGSEGLKIVNLSDPAAPVLSGRIDTPGSCSDLALVPHHGVVADGPSGVQIVDLFGPGAPAIVGHLPTAGPATVVATHGRYAYVAVTQDYTAGLLAVDLANPAAPAVVDSLFIPGGVLDMAIVRDRAFLISMNSGLTVVDISDPAAMTRTFAYWTLRGTAIAAEGGKVYVIRPGQEWHGSPGEFLSIDVSSPSTPVLRGMAWFPYRTPGSLAVRGAFAYVGCPAATPSLFIVDVRDPAAPLPIMALAPGGWQQPAALVRGIAVAGDLVLTTAGGSWSGLELYPASCSGVTGVPWSGAVASPAAATLRAFPNPGRGDFSIRLTSSRAGFAAAAIFDAAGRRVRRLHEGGVSAGSHDWRWDSRDDAGRRLEGGVYFLRVIVEGETMVEKVILSP